MFYTTLPILLTWHLFYMLTISFSRKIFADLDVKTAMQDFFSFKSQDIYWHVIYFLSETLQERWDSNCAQFKLYTFCFLCTFPDSKSLVELVYLPNIFYNQIRFWPNTGYWLFNRNLNYSLFGQMFKLLTNFCYPIKFCLH